MLDRRPLVVAGSGFALGLTALPHPVHWLFLAVLCGVLVRMPMRGVALAAFALGIWRAPVPPAPIPSPTFVQGWGTVVSPIKRGSDGDAFTVLLGGRRWRAFTTTNPGLAMGDALQMVGAGLPLREGTDTAMTLQEISGRLRIVRIGSVRPGPWWLRMGAIGRQTFRAFLDRWLDPPQSALVEAASFDLNAAPDPATVEAMKRLGVLHFLTASGFNVYLLIAAAFGVLAMLPIPRPIQIGVVLLGVVGYAAATGFAPAVVRAGLTSALAMVAYLVGREPDLLSAGWLAGLLWLVVRPVQVYAPGFQLSLAILSAIALFGQPDRASPGGGRRMLTETLGVGMAVMLATAPLTAYHFGVVPLLGLPVGFVLAFPFAMVVLSAGVGYALSWVVPMVGGGVVSGVTGPLAAGLDAVVVRLGSLGWAEASVPGFSAYWLPLVYGLYLMLWRRMIRQPELPAPTRPRSGQ